MDVRFRFAFVVDIAMVQRYETLVHVRTPLAKLEVIGIGILAVQDVPNLYRQGVGVLWS